MSLECPINDKKLIVGYTTREHLVLDLDHTSLPKVIGLACQIIYDYPDVGKCQIMQSSQEKTEPFIRITKRGVPRQHFPKACYHLIFDNVIGYKRCMHIILTLVDLGILDQQYKRIRMFRGDMTVRVSPMVLSNTVKEAPEPVMQILNIYNSRSDGMILNYHKLRHSVSSLFLGSLCHLVTA